jgi:opacity protein-like surface antigen
LETSISGTIGPSVRAPSFPAGFLWATASKQTETGFVVGGGVEKALSADWTIRAEYLFYRLSGKGPVVVNGVPPLPPFQFSYSWADFNTNVVRIALSRKFN